MPMYRLKLYENRPYLLGSKGWVVPPHSHPRRLRSTDRLSGFHDKLHAYHVVLLHALSQLSTENGVHHVVLLHALSQFSTENGGGY